MVEDAVPTHIGLILDGNRRWAKQRGLPVLEGHQHGYETLNSILDHALERGIKYISVFVFSTENWNRTKLEVGYLMDFSFRMIAQDFNKLHEKGIKLVWLGSENRVSKKLKEAIRKAEDRTAKNTKMTLGLCFNYGGQQEIVDAVKKIVSDGTQAENIDEAMISQNLYGPDLPPIDLLIRTSGEQRISNFMLWRVAYSELLFVEKLWPDFDTADFDAAIREYSKRNRRYGG